MDTHRVHGSMLDPQSTLEHQPQNRISGPPGPYMEQASATSNTALASAVTCDENKIQNKINAN